MIIGNSAEKERLGVQTCQGLCQVSAHAAETSANFCIQRRCIRFQRSVDSANDVEITATDHQGLERLRLVEGFNFDS